MPDVYDQAVEQLVQQGDIMTGADFDIEIEGYPNLSLNTVTVNPELPGHHPVEDVPGKGGITVNIPGKKKTGGQMPLTFQSPINGKAFDELAEWMEAAKKLAGRKKVRIWATDGTEGYKSGLDFTYKYCWPEAEAPDFDYENKTAPAKFTCNIHFANRMRTKDDVSG